MDAVVWIVGGAVAFAFGIWAGLGYPGWYDKYDPGPPRARRMNTWLNRWFLGGPRPRRFTTAHLVRPPSRPRSGLRVAGDPPAEAGGGAAGRGGGAEPVGEDAGGAGAESRGDG
jgi:hypothetical protein